MEVTNACEKYDVTFPVIEDEARLKQARKDVEILFWVIWRITSKSTYGSRTFIKLKN